MKFSNTLFGLGVGAFACGAAALSLGDARGSVVLGQPLDVVFEVQTDPGKELDPACMKATATAGDTQIDSSRLRIVAQPLVAGRPPAVRVHSSVTVLEPILTVQLTVGCLPVVSRTYHFFADLPAAAPPGTLPVAIAPLAAPLGNAQGEPAPRPDAIAPHKSARAASAGQGAAPLRPRHTRQPAPADAVPSPGAPTSSSPSARRTEVAAPAVPAVPPHARLVVEPLKESLAVPPPLRLSPSLQSAPSESSRVQGGPAGALKQASNTDAEELGQANTRLLQQQADLKAAHASNAKMQAALTDLQQRMDRLDRERYAPTLVYGLLGLLVLAVALLGWLWSRTQSAWKHSAAPLWNHSDLLRPGGPVVAAQEETSHSPTEPSALPQALAPDAAPGLAGPSALPAVPAAEEPGRPASAPGPVLSPAVRVVHPEELFDLQQQAEFFMSVGEHDQAIEVMKKHIAENEKNSPLIYLELLRLYRALSRVEDFNQVRGQFHRYFNAQVPEFSDFHGVHRTLFDYPDSLAAIEAVWNDATVVPLLESYIFCSYPGKGGERFELQAYDDLLMLYAIASTTPATARGTPGLRQRTTPGAAQALQPAVVQTPAVLEQGQDLELGLDVPWDRLTGRSPEKKEALLLDGNLIEFENYLAATALDEPVPLSSHRAAANDWTLDFDLTEPTGTRLGAALPEITRVGEADSVSKPAQPLGEPTAVDLQPNAFDELFDFKERDPGRS